MNIPEKYKVFTSHFRRYEEVPDFLLTRFAAGDKKPLAKGGVTEVVIVDKKGNVMAEGRAYCSDRDNFCRKIGRNIATGRAIKELKSNV